MDFRWRQMQRRLQEDPSILPAYLHEAARLNILSDDYLKYLAIIGMSPGLDYVEPQGPLILGGRGQAGILNLKRYWKRLSKHNSYATYLRVVYNFLSTIDLFKNIEHFYPFKNILNTAENLGRKLLSFSPDNPPDMTELHGMRDTHETIGAEFEELWELRDPEIFMLFDDMYLLVTEIAGNVINAFINDDPRYTWKTLFMELSAYDAIQEYIDVIHPFERKSPKLMAASRLLEQVGIASSLADQEDRNRDKWEKNNKKRALENYKALARKTEFQVLDHFVMSFNPGTEWN